jgi:hypothetical protein
MLRWGDQPAVATHSRSSRRMVSMRPGHRRTPVFKVDGTDLSTPNRVEVTKEAQPEDFRG